MAHYPPLPADRIRGLMLAPPLHPEAVRPFMTVVGEVLPALGINTLLLPVQLAYPFTRYPEISASPALTPQLAADIRRLCRDSGIHLIPKANLLGHQSDNGGTQPGSLLTAHPDMDESPDLATTGYCRSLCPRHPLSVPIVSAVIGELMDVFEADSFHTGLDEVWEIGHCPRCRDTSTAELFAGWVNTLHNIIAGHGGRMYMWGDRLLDPEQFKFTYGKYESGHNGTSDAIHHIPKDIVICDWHYAVEPDGQPTPRYLTQMGFDVLACPWGDQAAAIQLVSQAPWEDPHMRGVLQTSWCEAGDFCRALTSIFPLRGDAEALAAVPEDVPYRAARNLLMLADA